MISEAETIRRRILDDAVASFASSNRNEAGSGRFTTAHYAQALKREFKTPGPVTDGEVCRKHLSEMDDVEQVGPCLWRRIDIGPMPGETVSAASSDGSL